MKGYLRSKVGRMQSIYELTWEGKPFYLRVTAHPEARLRKHRKGFRCDEIEMRILEEWHPSTTDEVRDVLIREVWLGKERKMPIDLLKGCRLLEELQEQSR